MRTVRPRSLVITTLLAASLAAACSSSSKSSSSASAGATTTVAVSGSHVNVGFVDIEGDLGVDFTAQRKVAQDTVAHLNAIGGIGGHPIKLMVCVTKVASGGADCANQLVQQKAVLVLTYSIIDTATMYPILKGAGIPVLGGGNAPLNAADFKPDGNHFFTQGGVLVGFLAEDKFIAKTLKAKSEGVFVGSSSAAQQAAATFVKAPLEKLGVSVKTVPISESNPDYTAAVNAVAGTDVLQVLTSCQTGDQAMKQAVTLGYAGKLLGCSDPADLRAMGSAAKNLYGGSAVKPVGDPAFANDPDVKAFLTLADQYGWDKAVVNEQAYSLVLAAKEMIVAAGGPAATGPQVAAAIAATSHAPLALGPPGGLTCATVQSTLAPSACNVGVMFLQVQADGTSVRAVDGTWVEPPAS